MLIFFYVYNQILSIVQRHAVWVILNMFYFLFDIKALEDFMVVKGMGLSNENLIN